MLPPNPVRTLSLLVEFTRRAVSRAADHPRTAAAAGLHVASVGDVDDALHWPMCTLQIMSAMPVANGPYGEAVRARVRFVVEDTDLDRAEDAAVALSAALVDCWRKSPKVSEGWVTGLEVEEEPIPSTYMGDTNDRGRLNLIALFVLRKGAL